MTIAGITAGSLLVLLLGVWLTHRLAKSREVEKREVEATLTFRAVLETVIADVSRHHSDLHHLFLERKPAVLDAATRFRSFVRARERPAYDRDVSVLTAAINNLTPGINNFYPLEATGESTDAAEREQLLTALEAVVEHARA